MAPPSKSPPAPLSEELVAYVDGASRGNPGPSSYGVVIQDAHGKLLDTLSEYLGVGTNNVAEYQALLAALEYASERQARRLKIYCDSELVARQMQGRYRVQSPDLKPLYERARKLVAQLTYFSIISMPREQNRQADLLANQALDKAMGRAPEPVINQRLDTPAPARRASPAQASSRGVQSFSAVVEAGRLKPLPPLPELEEGAEYELRAIKR